MTSPAPIGCDVADDDFLRWDDFIEGDCDGSDAAPSMMSMIELLAVDPDALTTDAAIDFLAELQRHQSWLVALEARALVAVMGPVAVERRVEFAYRDPSRTPQVVTVVDEVRDEIAAALHRSPASVHESVERARLLHGPLRRTRDALAAGRLDPDQARTLVRRASRMRGRDIVTGQSPEADTAAASAERQAFTDNCKTLQDRLLERAGTATPAQIGAMADRAITRIDASGAAARREAARREVDVRITADRDAEGMAVLFARLDLMDAARLAAAIHARAADPGLPAPCNATAGQRRVAALLDLACGRQIRPDGERHGEPVGDCPLDETSACGGPVDVQAHIDVVIDLATLLGLADQPGSVTAPGLDGSCLVPGDAIRELLADPGISATLRRLVVDPLSGELLDRGRRSYAVPDALRAFITTRDGTCRFPGCRRRAAACQIDHAEPWDDGGRTDRLNLGALCVRHHQLKTLAGWQITDCGSDGSCTWTSPLGRRYSIASPWTADHDRPIHPPDGEPDAPEPPDPPPF